MNSIISPSQRTDGYACPCARRCMLRQPLASFCEECFRAPRFGVFRCTASDHASAARRSQSAVEAGRLAKLDFGSAPAPAPPSGGYWLSNRNAHPPNSRLSWTCRYFATRRTTPRCPRRGWPQCASGGRRRRGEDNGELPVVPRQPRRRRHRSDFGTCCPRSYGLATRQESAQKRRDRPLVRIQSRASLPPMPMPCSDVAIPGLLASLAQRTASGADPGQDQLPADGVIIGRQLRLPPDVSEYGHYSMYQLDPSDHITAGFSVECGSDAAALRAARTLLERSAGVEVWNSANRIAHLSREARLLWDQQWKEWMASCRGPPDSHWVVTPRKRDRAANGEGPRRAARGQVR